MNTANDYLFRPSQPDETTNRLQLRLTARQFSSAVRFANEHGETALNDYLDKRATLAVAKAIRKGLVQDEKPAPARIGRVSILEDIYFIRPEEIGSKGRLSDADRLALASLAEFLESRPAAAGVVVVRALPQL